MFVAKFCDLCMKFDAILLFWMLSFLDSTYTFKHMCTRWHTLPLLLTYQSTHFITESSFATFAISTIIQTPWSVHTYQYTYVLTLINNLTIAVNFIIHTTITLKSALERKLSIVTVLNLILTANQISHLFPSSFTSISASPLSLYLYFSNCTWM